MQIEKYTYLLLMLGSLAYPLAQSFEKRLQFYRKFKYLFPAMVCMAFVFIIWDIWFTASDVWHFNDAYVMGWYIWGLPVEEWSFFFVVAFACVFIYEVLIYFIPKFYYPRFSFFFTLVAIVVLVILAVYNVERLYTLVCFMFAASMLAVQLIAGTHRTYLSRFYLAYAISLVPFGVVNGVLTAFPVVEYNDAMNLGIRLYTIPVEDTMYSLGMFLLTVSIYEFLLARYLKRIHW